MKKTIKVIGRLLAICLLFAAVSEINKYIENDGNVVTLIENAALYSVGVSDYSGEKTRISYFTGTSATEKTENNTTITSCSTTTICSTTKMTTTVPTGENIKGVSEEQLISSKINHGKIYVKNTNKNHGIDISEILKEKPECSIRKNSDYQVMIVHTHTTECYAMQDRKWYDTNTEWRNTDEKNNIVSVGAIISERLNEAGIKTLHVTVKHDYPKYNGAYTRAKDTISKYLEMYPSIDVVIDVHRDSITRNDKTKVKPTAVIDGRKAAQIMIISGCDDEGDLDFPDWEYNLRFALRLQKQLTEDWPGLARPLYFAPFRYNMHMTRNSILVEFGTEVNTLEEAQYSAHLLSTSLISMLEQYIEE